MRFGNGLVVLLVGMLVSSVSGAASDASGVQIEAGLSKESLNKGYADWSSTYVEAEKKMAERHAVYGMLRETERYDLKDGELLAGYYHPLGRQWTSLLEANASPTHHVLPKWSVLGQLQYAFGDGWGAHFGLRHTEYDAALTNLRIFTLERYWGDYRAAYTLYSGHLAGAGSALSQRIQFSRYYADHSWLGVALSGGEELENLGSAGVQHSDVQSLIFNGRHWFSRDWALTYEATLHRQGDYYTRNGVRLGLRRQF